MRAFVSIECDGLEDAIEQAQEPFEGLPGVRTTDPTQTHLTLKFLGDIEQERLPVANKTIEDAIEQSGIDPFSLEIGGYGVFPSMDYISVVWVGCRDGSEQVTTLHQAIEDALTAEGFPPSDHAFTPHTTIARVSDGRAKQQLQKIVQEQEPTIGRLQVQEVRLKESELRSDGPEHSTIERFPL